MPPDTIPPLRILLIDDHRLVRDGIKAMLPLNTAGVRFEFDDAENTREAIHLVSTCRYDVILMDYSMPGLDGHTATAIIRKKQPDTPILALSSYAEKAYVNRMMAAGASGYVLKSVDPDTLVDAIKTVLAGGRYYSNEIAQKLIDDNSAAQQGITPGLLTDRESDVLRLVLKGKTSREIAARLGISPRTVDKHRQRTMIKLKVKNAAELGEAVRRLNILSL